MRGGPPLCYIIAPPPPTNVTASATSSTSIRVSWTNSASTAVIGFLVAFSPSPGECEGVEGGNVTLGGIVSSHTLNGLEEFVQYEVTVHSQGEQGLGVPSPAVQKKTLNDCKPLIPFFPYFLHTYIHMYV